MITYQNIDVAFQDFTAVKDLNLHINEGEFFTFLGPSGCGKSTTLRTLAGFVEPRSGKILVDGTDVTHLAPNKRNIGMVFQNYALFPSMSVRENIAFGLKVASLPRKEIAQRVHEIAEKVKLHSTELDKNLDELSGGQQQRVAIARALVMRPKILLLDEPLSNLDAALRQQLRLELKKLQAEFGITTIYVTHDQEEALSMSDRIAVFNHGKIEQIGTPTEIYERSATEFVCNFVGASSALTEVILTALNNQGAALRPQASSYIRGEKIAFVPFHHALPLRGRVVAQHYQGITSTAIVSMHEDPQCQLSVIYANDQQSYPQVGQECTVFINPADVLQFDSVASAETDTEVA
ncbi:ABC transporter ATP-binding protein [Corynebacterium sp. sy017]|uniref:ABC transporter ATP-binding protein n=1 Tax=unclassified Corynebacterium TaxID=2624378 RepID=UPI001185E960|nr:MULTISPECIES: ABC transporter ATP-binding protein [unclassified Corynebacterium]MBP3088498.1 ABC transporter ATP-binding protein [Corynebacterium sp. sy017]QDZ41919.1 ABC transporter ATP-binding protein [Corynebacterium sp. sy039]TSD91803.1 ABC transporter ATP-binding protein [Corynebacterium sp. SY003]